MSSEKIIFETISRQVCIEFERETSNDTYRIYPEYRREIDDKIAAATAHAIREHATITIPIGVADRITAFDVAVARAARASITLTEGKVRCPENSDIMSLAMDCFDAGFAVIPVSAKNPFAHLAFRDWYYPEFRPSEDEIHRYFAHFLHTCKEPMGYGILMGPSNPFRAVAFDCDTEQAYAAFQAAFPNYPWRQLSNQKKKKGHFLFRTPDDIDPHDIPAQMIGIDVTLPDGTIARGVDVKAARSYILGPGSYHVSSGLRYLAPVERWWDHPILDIPVDTLRIGRAVESKPDKAGKTKKPMPIVSYRQRTEDESRDRRGEKRVASTTPPQAPYVPFCGGGQTSAAWEVTGEDDDILNVVRRARAWARRKPGADSGERNNECFKLAARLLCDFALDRAPDEALSILMSWADTCDPPLSERETTSIFRSAQKKGGNNQLYGTLAKKVRRKGGVEINFKKPPGWDDNHPKDHPEPRGKCKDSSCNNSSCKHGKESPAEPADSSYKAAHLDANRCAVANHELPPTQNPKKKKKKYAYMRVEYGTINTINKWISNSKNKLEIEENLDCLSPDDAQQQRKRAARARRNLQKALACETGAWKHKGRMCPIHGESASRQFYCRLPSCMHCASNEANLASPWCVEKWSKSFQEMAIVEIEVIDGNRIESIKSARRDVVSAIKKCGKFAARWVESHKRVLVVCDPGVYDALSPEKKDGSPYRVGALSVKKLSTSSVVTEFFSAFTEPAVAMWRKQLDLGMSSDEAKIAAIVNDPFLSACHEQRHVANELGRKSIPYPSQKDIARLGMLKSMEENGETVPPKPGCCRIIDTKSGLACNETLSPGYYDYLGHKICDAYNGEEGGIEGDKSAKKFEHVVLSGMCLLGRGVQPSQLRQALISIAQPEIISGNVVRMAPNLSKLMLCG